MIHTKAVKEVGVYENKENSYEIVHRLRRNEA